MHLAFVVSNPQLVRNYFFGKNANLLKEITFNHCTIICEERVVESINVVVDLLDYKIRSKVNVVSCPKTYKSSFFINLLFFIFESTGKSNFLRSKFYTFYSKQEISKLNLELRKFINRIFSDSKVINSILRLILASLLSRQNSRNFPLNFDGIDLVVALSLTDRLDSKAVAIAKKHGIKTLGTVRSWDNITSKGLIKVLPDVFYSHSAKMTQELIDFQNITDMLKPQIVTGKSYWIDFNLVQTLSGKKTNNGKKILYGAMGKYFNPSEEHLIEKLYMSFKEMKNSGFNLTILVHPRYPVSESIINKFSDIILFDQFSFSNDPNSNNFNEYLEYLSNFDCIVSSGSTLLLDASLINSNILHINFDVKDVNYWESTMRYLDFREYYSHFIKLSRVTVVSSYQNLIDEISSGNFVQASLKNFKREAAQNILGSNESESLTQTISRFS